MSVEYCSIIQTEEEEGKNASCDHLEKESNDDDDDDKDGDRDETHKSTTAKKWRKLE